MNLIIGTLDPEGGRLHERLSDTVASLYGRLPTPPGGAGTGEAADTARVAPGGAAAVARAGAIDDGGIVVGRAADDGVSLVLLGGLHEPLPGWTGSGRPADDPGIAARWLLDRYREEGPSFLDGVNGQLAVLITDRDGRLVAAAGGGLRSLFLYRGAAGVAVSSNLFVLARALRDEVVIDRSLEDFFLVYGYLPWGRTIFREIITLEPDIVHVWAGGEHETRPVERGDPWADRFPPLEPEEASEDAVIDRLYDAFMTATEEQTGSAREAAVLLGGVDSALVAAALHRLGKEVRTYSFHYDDPVFDQPHTDTLSAFLGSRHEWVPITPEVMREGLERYGLLFSRPTNWPNYVIQTARVCEVIREHGIFHVHSGDGADHTFMGYPRTHEVARAYQRVPRLPAPLGRALIRLGDRPWLERRLGRPYRVGMNILRNLSRSMPQRGFLTFRVFDESSLKRLRSMPPPTQEGSVESLLEQVTRGLEELSPGRLAYLGKANVSANKAKLGGSSDHTGVIIYAPYMHPGLKALAIGLPDRLLRPDGDPDTAVTGKYALLRMAERKRMLPREVIYQRKVAAVDAPVDDWYAGPLRSDVRALLDHLPFEANDGYLDRLLEPTALARFYARRLSSDRLTSHEASLLATYAALARALD